MTFELGKKGKETKDRKSQIKPNSQPSAEESNSWSAETYKLKL